MRRLLLVAIFLAAAAPVPAQVLELPRISGPRAPAVSEPLDLLADPSPGATAPAATTPVSTAATYETLLGPEQQSPAPMLPEFRPVWDCGCQIECLDVWCDCSEPCCTTDTWCPHPCDCSKGNCYLTPDGCWVANDAMCDIWGLPEDQYNTAFRFGGWGTTTDGSLNKIGEYQDLNPSPFWDVDGIYSNAQRTLDFTLSGLDNEANFAQGSYYGPGLTAKVRYNRFLRRLDHDPLFGFPRPTFPAQPGPNDNVVVQDLNVGEDYAIRVNQLDARFQGRISNNLKWRLNLWGMRKFGERQANATAHCFNVNAPAPPGANGNVCHVLSQRQSIDWTTMEIQPVVEAQFENVTIEYSRTMRGFAQGDQIIVRQYTRFGYSPASGVLGAPFEYAIVPESFTQIDRLKFNINVSDTQQIYANLYVGDTHNDFRDTHRQYGGYDVRWIDRSFDQLTSTAYVSMYDENNDLPTTYFTTPPFGATTANPAQGEPGSLRHPVDYQRVRVGLKGNYRPSLDPTNGLRWVGGYEYYELNRDYAEYGTALGPFVQPNTRSHNIEIGPEMRWSQTRTSYIRYKARFFEDPLIGVREANGLFNTNQPEQDHRVDIGGTWNPAENFVATAQFSVVSAWHYSQFANFSEDSYPFFVTLWYAPTDRLSLTGAYAYYSNWIDQDITLGFTVPNVPVPPVRTETTNWNYRGENHLVSLNANYAWSPTVSLVAGYEWDRGTNGFTLPPSPAGANWTALPTLSDVIIETQRATLGADWQPYSNLALFARYVYYDWNDVSANFDSGTAHMALGGATLMW
jgi:hypothetical protein